MLGISKCPLSPEQLKSLKIRVSAPKHDIQSNESWSIGILLLCMATLSSENVLYNWKDFEIDTRGFNHLMSQLKTKYSPLFVELVTKCLETDPINRPTLSDILGYLTKRKEEEDL